MQNKCDCATFCTNFTFKIWNKKSPYLVKHENNNSQNKERNSPCFEEIN